MRAVHRVLGVGSLTTFASKPAVWRRSFGPVKKRQVAAAQRKLAAEANGMIGPATQSALTPYLDAYARGLLKPAPPDVKLTAPTQGFGSLSRKLWWVFSLGRGMGLSDLGTFNPQSRLPSGAPSDHAVFPARAFDLGFSRLTRAAADRFFDELTGHPDVEYVIMEQKIWSRSRGLRVYTSGGHETHIHVSGRR